MYTLAKLKPLSALFLLMVMACFKISKAFAQQEKPTMGKLDTFYMAKWNQPQYSKANTCADVPYLTDTEKKVVYYLNLARLNPGLFAATYASSYKGSVNYSEADGFAENEKSLIADLNKLQPLPIFLPNKNLYDLALCHASSIGKSGLETHDRKASGCPDGYMAECISFGDLNALDIVMQLLNDAGVESLGHRKICLSSEYSNIGCSNQLHKVWGKCTVLDFAPNP